MNKQNNNNNLHVFSGKLIYDQDNNYILHSPTQVTNITTILKKIYCWYSNEINIRILKGCKILFNEHGRLLTKLDSKYGISSYHVNGLDLECVMFFNVGEDLYIEISNSVLDEIEGLGVEYIDGKN